MLFHTTSVRLKSLNLSIQNPTEALQRATSARSWVVAKELAVIINASISHVLPLIFFCTTATSNLVDLYDSYNNTVYFYFIPKSYIDVSLTPSLLRRHSAKWVHTSIGKRL